MKEKNLPRKNLNETKISSLPDKNVKRNSHKDAH